MGSALWVSDNVGRAALERQIHQGIVNCKSMHAHVELMRVHANVLCLRMCACVFECLHLHVSKFMELLWSLLFMLAMASPKLSWQHCTCVACNVTCMQVLAASREITPIPQQHTRKLRGAPSHT